MTMHFRCSDNVNAFVFEIQLRKYFHLVFYKLHICCVCLPNLSFFWVFDMSQTFLSKKNEQKHQTRKRMPIKKHSADFALFNSLTNQLNKLKDTILSFLRWLFWDYSQNSYSQHHVAKLACNGSH